MDKSFFFTVRCEPCKGVKISNESVKTENKILQSVIRTLNTMTIIMKPYANYSLHHVRNDKDYGYVNVINTSFVEGAEIDYQIIGRLVFSIYQREIKSLFSQKKFVEKDCYITDLDIKHIEQISQRKLVDQERYEISSHIGLLMKYLSDLSHKIAVSLYRSEENSNDDDFFMIDGDTENTRAGNLFTTPNHVIRLKRINVPLKAGINPRTGEIVLMPQYNGGRAQFNYLSPDIYNVLDVVFKDVTFVMEMDVDINRHVDGYMMVHAVHGLCEQNDE